MCRPARCRGPPLAPSRRRHSANRPPRIPRYRSSHRPRPVRIGRAALPRHADAPMGAEAAHPDPVVGAAVVPDPDDARRTEEIAAEALHAGCCARTGPDDADAIVAPAIAYHPATRPLA